MDLSSTVTFRLEHSVVLSVCHKLTCWLTYLLTYLLAWVLPRRCSLTLLSCLSYCALNTYWYRATTAPHPTFSTWLHLFCGAGYEKKRGEQSSGSFPCAQLPGPVHTARLGRVCFSILGLGLCLACSFVLFDLFVSLGSWVISLTVLGTSVTNLNEPPRALATSTIMWIRS